LKYSIENVIERYPKINIGVLEGQDLEIAHNHSGLVKFREEAIFFAENQIGCNPVTRHPFIASWRGMYRSFGTKAGDYRPSAEALLRRTLKSQQLPAINTAVDTYNAISVKHLIPIGGFDLDKVEGDISLRFSSGEETFVPLGSKSIEKTYEGEVVYADSRRILTRRWNFRDCDWTKITFNTTDLVMFLDGSLEMPQSTIKSALDELVEKLEKFCKGVYFTSIADLNNPVIELKRRD
jgi:DNA/RNA-binding domain of Phe-tRNA-synthetase-like protein